MNNIFAQAQLEIPITVSNNAPTPSSTNMFVGLDPAATSGLDPALGEANLPPLPPGGVWDARFDLGGGVNSFRDFRNAPVFPYTGTYTSVLKWQQQTGATTVTISYDMPSNSTITIQDQFGGVLVNSGALSGTGSYTITNAALSAVNLILDYAGVAPPVSGPIFNISPASPITVAPTAVGGSNTANVTVSNPGSAQLDITGITSSNPEFSIAPTTATIPVGGNQVFVVTFTPASLGSKTSDLVFSHNAAGSPTTYIVNGVGAEAGPTFSVSPVSLTFNTNQGTPVTANVTVINNGFTNPLNITSVSASPSEYSVSPLTANIAPGASQVFSVTFNPASGGSFPGTLTFTHNGTSSPDAVSLSGSAVSVFGLVFKNEERYAREDSSYTDTLQLKSLNASAQAIQFRLLVNKSAEDNSILTFQSIEKGSSVSSANWSLQYQVFRGPLGSNGASVDSIYVLLYNLQQNTGLPAGDHDDLLRVKYRIANLPGGVDTAKSSFRIAYAQGSTFQGFPIDITPSRVEFKVFGLNRASSQGDVNGDGSLDILDLINVVDHIIGRDSLDTNITPGFTTSEFERANIAPWAIGAQFPASDAIVNVQDLAVIQNIILTGFLPSGVQLNKTAIAAGNSVSLQKNDAAKTKVILFVTNEGISVKSNSDYAIRGIQLEFNNIEGTSSNMIIDSRLGGGFYYQTNDLLRVLLYDQAGNATIDAGENFIANLPFTLNNPADIKVEKVIVVNTSSQKITELSVEIIYSNAPDLPVDYSLSQNYPNPFNPTTSLQFSVPKDGMVTLKVYDMLGQEVVTLFSGQAKRGTYTLSWNGKDDSGNYVSSGSYIYRINSNGEFTQSRKMIFLK